MIEVRNLTKKYKDKIAVDIKTLEIKSGELVGIVGNNGAGKTTLFRLILDLIEANSGTVSINTNDVSKDWGWKDHTSSFIDSNFLIDFFTPNEYFYFVGKLYKLSKKEVDKRLELYIKFMNGEILNQKKYIRSFSSGNKQKIGIIAAMMVDPEILILDEPFNFLDPSSQIEIKNLLQSFHQQFGTTIIISSHNLNYICDISTRILLMDKGSIAKDVPNTPETISEIFDFFK